MDSDKMEVDLGSATLTFLLGSEDIPNEVDNVDVVLTLDDGTKWSATVLSLQQIAAKMERWRQTGEYLSGEYFTSPDLVVVRGRGVSDIVAVFRDIIHTGGPEGILCKIA
jgi:hypothetical protein